ncbi:hypothetical protein BLNAU_15522 [Blattamonas nauphoetae]|uniref:Uncharacterized protein n=1 Tax=Blattamonas nauphoetae TaxID=2049346 RepID=A0ABQ9XH75_9EUKA|nr:hypothetical protein BLNAU_15522 [Blattamonas nauphoetae]
MSLEATYPLWRRDEFLTMLIRLGKTDPRFWRRIVPVLKLCEMHPLVVKILGAHGQYVPNPADRKQASVMMNVIDVFGLTPRILGYRSADAFLDVMKALSFESFPSNTMDNDMPTAPLTYLEETQKPISLFATKLLPVLQKLRS